MEAAVRDFMVWEPGQTLICALCEGERGGDDPPGPWFRHQPSARRRIPIFHQGEWSMPIMGYLEYVYP
jgi:hypothetical protein